MILKLHCPFYSPKAVSPKRQEAEQGEAKAQGMEGVGEEMGEGKDR